MASGAASRNFWNVAVPGTVEVLELSLAGLTMHPPSPAASGRDQGWHRRARSRANRSKSVDPPPVGGCTGEDTRMPAGESLDNWNSNAAGRGVPKNKRART